MMVLLLAGAGLAWLLQKWLYENYWDFRFGVRIRFTEPFVYEGDRTCLVEEITNDKRLPLPAVEVRFAMDRSLVFAGEAQDNSNITDQSYRRDIFSLFMNQRVVRRLPVTCRRRGVYEISEADVVGHDFFFTKRHLLRVEQCTQLYVYPGAVDVSRIGLVCQAISGQQLVQNRLYPDPFEFAGIREYRPSDPQRQINWKASARSGELLVNQYDSTTNMQVRILLDLRDEGIWKRDELVEESIRIASSLAAQLTKKSVELEVLANAPSAGQPCLHQHLRPGAGQMQELYRALACVDARGAVVPMEQALAASTCESGYVQVLLSHNQDEETAQLARSLAQAGSGVLWVVPVSHRFPLERQSVPGVRVIPWEAE